MEQSNAMIYKVSWTEVVNYSIVVDAKTEEEAREAVMFGQFYITTEVVTGTLTRPIFCNDECPVRITLYNRPERETHS